MLVEWLLSAGLMLALDQASKTLALTRPEGKPRSPTGWGPRIRRVGHPPIALGLIGDRRALLLLWTVAVVGTILLIHHVPPFHGQAPQVGLGAALGGATGNLLDALRRGAVVDFIDFRIWPVFNLADAGIVVGVAVALWSAGGFQALR